MMKFTFAPEATPLAGYTIKRAIDRGGFGEVYYALSDSGKEVALKLLQRNQQVELRGVSQCLNLKHPNLVSIFDIRTDADGDHWVVMEYVAGKSLETVLDENPNGLPLPDVEAWLSGIATGTAFLHDRGIVHRDLKPANVFRENGVVKIGDVGLSKFITPSRRSAQTDSVGTVYYMAPEVARGKYGSELDVYSLGVMLYEMLTGHVPFSGESTGEILMKHLTEPPDLAKLPAQFRSVVGRALEKDPLRRTPGTAQLLDEFRRARQGKPVAEEIPASHFVDVPQLEKNAALQSAVPPHGARSHPARPAETIHYQQERAANPYPMPKPPAPPRPFGSRNQKSSGDNLDRLMEEFRRRPWLAIVVLVGILTIVPRIGLRLAPGFAIGEMLLLAGASVGTYVVVTKLVRKPPASPGASPPFGECASNPQANPKPVVVSRPEFAPRAGNRPLAPPNGPQATARPVTPDTPRPIPLRWRLREVSESMTMAVLWSALATGAASALSAHLPLFSHARDVLHTPAGVGLFGLITLLGSWTILAASKFWEGTGLEPRQRRLIQTALGAAVGACAWWLHETLLVDLGYHNFFPGIVKHIGRFELLSNSPSLQPTLAAYVLFFGALFGIRRWWWLADSFRPKRFRISSLLVSGLLAGFIPAAFVFHQEWGILWGTAIAAVVQFSAPWVAVKDRPAVLAAGVTGDKLHTS